jgi:DNA-binding response OmpR family regulator
MHMLRILLIEDQTEFQFIVKAIFDCSRYFFFVATNASEALKILERNEVDLILLDIGLPDTDGFNLFSQLRTLPYSNEVPIIFLTGKKEVSDRVTGFSLGADDYIVKPFEPLEFRARIESKLQNRISRIQSRNILKKGRIELNQAMFKAFVLDSSGEKRDLELTPYEFRLLVHFMSYEGHVMTRDQLITAVWGDHVHVLERTIDRHISSLRRKLDPNFEKINSVRGIGYQFCICLEERPLF